MLSALRPRRWIGVVVEQGVIVGRGVVVMRGGCFGGENKAEKV